MKKHIFFDMDGTLTESRQSMHGGMTGAFERICDLYDVVVVSGASKKQIGNQVPDGHYSIMAQNGNLTLGPNFLWENKLPWDLKYWVFKWIHDSLYYNCEVKEWTMWPMPVEDLVEDRGCQVSYSMIGHHEDIEKKKAFDPDGKKRKQMLIDLPWRERRVEVAIGGTTCLDFYLAGKSKGGNIREFLLKSGWEPADCLYVGDALFPGGNDYTVLGVVPVLEVRGTSDTLEVINDLIKKA